MEGEAPEEVGTTLWSGPCGLGNLGPSLLTRVRDVEPTGHRFTPISSKLIEQRGSNRGQLGEDPPVDKEPAANGEEQMGEPRRPKPTM